MSPDIAYLSGLDLAPKDGYARLLRIPLAGPPNDRLDTINSILLTMQSVGYEILSAQIENGVAFLSGRQGVLVLYK